MRVAIVLFALLALGGAASAADNPACAKFEEPLAYNACLAKLGPKAYPAAVAPAPATAHERHAARYDRRGRVRAVFSIR
jgi:hypothetical protein